MASSQNAPGAGTTVVHAKSFTDRSSPLQAIPDGRTSFIRAVLRASVIAYSPGSEAHALALSPALLGNLAGCQCQRLERQGWRVENPM